MDVAKAVLSTSVSVVGCSDDVISFDLLDVTIFCDVSNDGDEHVTHSVYTRPKAISGDVTILTNDT